ncbi:hypothetical protein [Weissella viridescens]|uniref:hypothetical protein n=1 Tax=Weissella viridescens TaxID=1629 RepID=UPI0035282189
MPNKKIDTLDKATLINVLKRYGSGNMKRDISIEVAGNQIPVERLQNIETKSSPNGGTDIIFTYHVEEVESFND